MFISVMFSRIWDSKPLDILAFKARNKGSNFGVLRYGMEGEFILDFGEPRRRIPRGCNVCDGEDELQL